MKQLILLVSAFLITAFTYAQNVGINTTGAAPDAGAGLDVNFTNKGLLVPRVNITNLNTIAPVTGSATTSLLVYNTNGTTGTGYHYWNGAQWVRLALSSEAWQVDGNAGLDANNNFLGTTDNVAVRIRTNNVERFEFTTNGRLRSLNAGTSGAPTYSWTADNDIGMFRPAVNQLAFSTAGNERMRITNDGKVIVGTTAGSGTFNTQLESTVNAGTEWAAGAYNNTPNAGGGLFISLVGGHGFSGLEGGTSGTGNGVLGLHNVTAGNGIGVTGQSNSWQGIGVFGARVNNGGANTGFAGLFLGTLGYSGGVVNLSDKRLKSNISEITNAVELITKLKPVSYYYDTVNYPNVGFNTSLEFGFIAQDLEKTIPEIVHEKYIPELLTRGFKEEFKHDDSDYFKMVDYTRVIPILTKAIQEQQEQIESYEERISKLESQLQELLEKQ